MAAVAKKPDNRTETGRFMPGQSGNPGGRKRDPITQALREIGTPEKAKKLGTMLWNLALAGDLKAAEIVLNRIEGKAIDRQEQGAPGDFDNLASVSDDDLKKILKMVS
jgi:hypothetical protein